MQDTLQSLIELQEIDSELVKIESEVQTRPGYLTVRQRQYDRCREKVEQLETEIKERELEIKRNELEMGSKEEQKAKLEVQLNAVKTNREYTALRDQIGGVEADKSRLEDKLLSLMDELDEVQGRLQEVRKTSVAAKRELDEGQKMASEDSGRLAEKVEELRSLRSRKTVGIPQEALRTYEKILGKRDGMGMAAVVDQTCQGCFMTITTHDLTIVTMGDVLVQCKFCNRILYLAPENAR